MNRRYRIVWADDDVFTLCNKQMLDYLQDKAIDVLERCINAKSLREYMQKAKPGTIDAVVVDANFPFDTFQANKERDTMGLKKVAQWVENPQFDYPFILYTGRRDLINGEDKELFEYFIDNQYVVYKDATKGVPALIAKIKETVDRRYSTAGVMLDHFNKELECAKVFDEICKGRSYPLLLDLLVKSHDNTLEAPQRCLNDIRAEILDKMLSKATECFIVPPGLSLNDFSRLICKGSLKTNESENESTVYSFRKSVLPTGLSMAMEYVVKTTQDGSHYGDKLRYQVRQYIGDSNNVNLIRSLLYAVLELMKWFMLYLEDHNNAQANQDNIIVE